MTVILRRDHNFCQYKFLENTYAVHGIHRDYVTEHLILMLRPPLCELYNEIKYKIEKYIYEEYLEDYKKEVNVLINLVEVQWNDTEKKTASSE